MRTIASISLIVLLLSKLFYGLMLQMHFYVNQAEITRLECENKNRPEMHCNGKCYLAKQLLKAENELKERNVQKDRSLSLMKISDTDCMTTPKITRIFLSYTLETKEAKREFYYQFSIQTFNLNSPFHPPCA